MSRLVSHLPRQGDLSLVTSELENHREEYEQIWPEVDDAMVSQIALER